MADRGLKQLKVFDTLTGNAVGTYALVTPAGSSNLALPLTIDASDNLYACNNGFLQKYDSSFNLLWSVSATGVTAGDPDPWFRDVALHPNGWVIVVDGSSSGQERFLRYSTSGAYQSRHTYRATTSDEFESVDAHPGGQLMFYSSIDRRWAILNEVGTFQSSLGDWPMPDYSRGAAFLQDGRILYATPAGLTIYSSLGAYIGGMHSTYSPYGNFRSISSITVAANGHFFVSELDGARVLEFLP